MSAELSRNCNKAIPNNGKKILPFCTHEGSGLGHSVEDIHRVCPGVEVRDGLAIRGSAAASSDRLIKEWLKQNDI